MMTMMLGFAVTACAAAGLTGNCACATPPKARWNARTAVAIRLLLIIDVSFQLPNLLAGQRAKILLHSARSGQALTFQMPTSSALKTKMLGFLVAVCADAVPHWARGIAMIAVVRKLRLNIDLSLHLPARRSTSPRLNLPPQEAGQ